MQVSVERCWAAVMNRETTRHSRVAREGLRGPENFIEDAGDIAAVQTAGRTFVQSSEIRHSVNTTVDKFNDEG